MSNIQHLVAITRSELARVQKDVEMHPEKGVFKFSCTRCCSYFDIFTNIPPEEVAELTHSTLEWKKNECGTRTCQLKFFWEPYRETNCIAFLWHVDGSWDLPE